MSNVTVNKVGMDIVDVEVRQKGEASTDMFFQDPILDYTRDYVIGISELQVPLNAEPMFSKNPNNDIILRICNRDPLYDFADPRVMPGGANVFRIGSIKSAGELYRALSEFGLNWVGNVGAGAAPNPRGLDIEVLAGGRLKISGDTEFWIYHFMITHRTVSQGPHVFRT